jgi:phospho-N-acetylmuramoyl-pentapeptide-transferase
MLYLLYEWLSRGGHEHVPLLNLLKYLTVPHRHVDADGL